MNFIILNAFFLFSDCRGLNISFKITSRMHFGRVNGELLPYLWFFVRFKTQQHLLCILKVQSSPAERRTWREKKNETYDSLPTFYVYFENNSPRKWNRIMDERNEHKNMLEHVKILHLQLIWVHNRRVATTTCMGNDRIVWPYIKLCTVALYKYMRIRNGFTVDFIPLNGIQIRV